MFNLKISFQRECQNEYILFKLSNIKVIFDVEQRETIQTTF